MTETKTAPRPCHCLHLSDDLPGKRRWWVLADGVHIMRGTIGGTRKALQAAWLARHGPPSHWVAYRELYSRGEAMATLADLELEVNPEAGRTGLCP